MERLDSDKPENVIKTEKHQIEITSSIEIPPIDLQQLPLKPEIQTVEIVTKRNQNPESKLSTYNKKALLRMLKLDGCCSMNEFSNKRIKINPEKAKEYLTRHSKSAEDHVHEECDSLSFQHMNSWLELFKSWGIPNLCDYEPALVTKTISVLEHLPNPAQLGGIDLRQIYNFIGNALMGMPQEPLTGINAKFLSNEFEMLINAANTDLADEQTHLLKHRLENIPDSERLYATQHKLSVDPLCLDENIQ